MDPSQYSTLMEALAVVPDPRKARGKRYPVVVQTKLMRDDLYVRVADYSDR